VGDCRQSSGRLSLRARFFPWLELRSSRSRSLDLKR
jgi:hypothetical protein